MNRSLVDYRCTKTIATITLDDGKANVMSEAMQRAIGAALDRAAAEAAVVVIAGREGIFSGGYDTTMFQRSREEIVRTIRAGAELVHRLLGFERPIVAACTGHAIAQGAFLLLAADLRIGAAGSFKIGLNEVAIGLTIPHYGIEVARLRLTPPWFNLATTTGVLVGPEEARQAGFLDQVAPASDLHATVQAAAQRLAKLDLNAHAGTKQRVRGPSLAAIRQGIDREVAGP